MVPGDPQQQQRSLPEAEAGGRRWLREQGPVASRWVLEVVVVVVGEEEVVVMVVCVSEPPDLSLWGLLHAVCSRSGSAQQAG